MSRKSCARPAHPRDRWRGPLAAALMLLAAASPAAAQAPPPARQALEDAWWTGSLSAPSAATLPAGHMVIEPYLIDSRPYGRFDSHGTRGDVPREDDFGSLIIMNYGLTDRFTVGAIPHFGYRRPAQGRGSSGIGLGDLTLQAQYRLTQWRPGSLVPTLSVNLGESLPLGEHDRLGDRPADGFGSGAYATIASLYAPMAGSCAPGSTWPIRSPIAPGSRTSASTARPRGSAAMRTPATGSISTSPSNTASPETGSWRSTWAMSGTAPCRYRGAYPPARPPSTSRPAPRPAGPSS